MRTGKIFSRVVLCLIGVFFLLSGILASDLPPARNFEVNIALIKLSMPSGNWIRFKAKNEALLVLRKGKTRFELTPLFQNEHDLLIKIRVLDGETVEQSRTLEVSAGSIAESIPSLPFIIEIEGIQQKTSIEQVKSHSCELKSSSGENVALRTNNYWSRKDSVEYKPALLVYRGVGSDECCLTCDGVRACACSVTASCGSCCVSSCC